MFVVQITHRPNDRFGHDEPVALAEPALFGGFRSRTGRRAASLYGGVPEVTFENWNRKAATWATREAAERNAAKLAERGYTASVVEQS